ncbi:MAG: OmpA family protein [Alphaproteobacteria bacterium]|nr:OmpA family protein [Alphaproteobacteria bacterium]
MSKNKTLIIRGKHKHGHEDHKSHGVWKIAYADFMTALMAFFLMMWLTSSMPENIRKGVATYFALVGASANVAGTNSILEGGQSLEEIGVLDKMKLEQSIFSPTTNYNAAPKNKSTEEPTSTESYDETTGSNSDAESAAKEQRVFEEAQQALNESILKDPVLQQLSENILISITPEGLKIELIDKNNTNMFTVGSKQMLPEMRTALSQVAKVIRVLPNKINITGHTDARPYSANAAYNNWDLSTDRALESRRFLVASEFQESKIAPVVGKASNDLLNSKDPLSSSNRRISILVLRNAPIEKGQKQ